MATYAFNVMLLSYWRIETLALFIMEGNEGSHIIWNKLEEKDNLPGWSHCYMAQK